MSKLPAIPGGECVKALGKAGFVIYRQRGSHVTMVRQNPAAQTTITLHTELDRGTLRAIIRQAGLTVDEFVSIVTMSLSAQKLNRYPIIHFTTHHSLVPVSPRPTPKFNSPSGPAFTSRVGNIK